MTGLTPNLHGSYRIDDTFFPAPITRWDEQAIDDGLNAIPILNSYRVHIWEFGELSAELAQLLYALHTSQQANNAQLSTLETDPYEGNLGTESYGTQVYTDFTIKQVSSRVRGYPNYQSVEVIFEVYVS